MSVRRRCSLWQVAKDVGEEAERLADGPGHVGEADVGDAETQLVAGGAGGSEVATLKNTTVELEKLQLPEWVALWSATRRQVICPRHTLAYHTTIACQPKK